MRFESCQATYFKFLRYLNNYLKIRGRSLTPGLKFKDDGTQARVGWPSRVRPTHANVKVCIGYISTGYLRLQVHAAVTGNVLHLQSARGPPAGPVGSGLVPSP